MKSFKDLENDAARFAKNITPGDWYVEVNEKDTTVESESWTIAVDMPNDEAEFLVWARNNLGRIQEALRLADRAQEQQEVVRDIRTQTL